MDSQSTYWADRAALEWLAELGADEAILEAPVNRYEVAATPPQALPQPPSGAPATSEAPPALPVIPEVDHLADARALAAGAQDLAALHAALEAYEGCSLKAGSRQTLFSKGDPAARLLVVVDPPDRNADRSGALLAGPEGLLLDNMLAAIGMGFDRSADAAVYAAPALPWRTMKDGPAQDADLELIRPFLHRHIALAAPQVVLFLGQNAARAVLGEAPPRGNWGEALGRPALSMRSPRHLLRRPQDKRDAWADLLALKQRLAP